MANEPRDVSSDANVVPDEQLDGVSGGKTSTPPAGKTSSLQVGPAPAKPIVSESGPTTQI